jgi:hypothetical protein
MLLASVTPACGATSASTRPSGSRPDAHAATRATLLPRLGQLSLVAEDAGTRAYLFGSLRVQISGDHVDVSRARFSAPIAAANEVEHGWVFVTQDGVVAGSDSFVGEPRRLGQTGVFAPAGARASRGRAVIADATGVLWQTDGTAPLAPIGSLADRAIDSAAFADARFGAALARTGELLVTSDGGATWRPVALGAHTIVSVSRVDEALVADTAAGPQRITREATLAPVTNAASETHRPAPGDTRRALDATLQAFPDLLPNLEAVDLADGTAVLVDRSVLVVLDRATGRVLRRVSGLPLGASRLAAWGSDVAIVSEPACADDDAHAYRWHGEEALPIAIPENARGAVFSDDARHAAKLRACRGERAQGPSICVLDDGSGAWRTLAVTRSLDRLVAMRGTQLLAHVENGPFTLIDASNGHAIDARVTGDADASVIQPVSLAFTHDAGLAGAGVDGDGIRYALVGARIDALRARPLPEGAVACGFGDRIRGVAAGRTAARLWRTLDGGEHWEHLDVGIDGEAREVPLLTDPRVVYSTLACDESGCQVGRAASVRGWGPLAPVATTVFAPLEPPHPSDPP